MVTQGKTEKLSVTLPKDLVAEIRSIAPQGEVSSFVAEGLAFYLAWRRQKIGLEKGFGAWTDENHPDLQTPEDTEAYVRRLREGDEERLAQARDALAE